MDPSNSTLQGSSPFSGSSAWQRNTPDHLYHHISSSDTTAHRNGAFNLIDNNSDEKTSTQGNMDSKVDGEPKCLHTVNRKDKLLIISSGEFSHFDIESHINDK